MRKFIAIALVFMFALSLIRCASNTVETETEAETTAAETKTNADSGKTNRLLLGTASIGGTYYALGGGWAKIISENVDNTEVSVEVTGGPTSNIQLIQKGDMELGYATTWLSGEGYNGEGWAKGTKYDQVLSMYPVFNTVLYVYTLKSTGIKTIYDFEGKNISVGSPGSTSDMAGRAVLEVLGITPKSISSLTVDATQNGLKDGTIDGSFLVAGVPVSGLLNLETTHEIEYISFSDEDMNKILEAYPYWSTDVVPEGTYTHQNGEFPVISFWNIAICAKDMPDDLVYNLVKTTFEHVDELIAVDPSSENTRAEKVGNCGIPLHPGALKYYQEMGIEIPDELILK
jgi:TRAP transporter TAXI family solute receptor